MAARQTHRVGQTFLSAQDLHALDCRQDPSATPSTSPSLTITRRRLPHWKQDNSINWITFSFADAIPQHKFRALKQERNFWLRLHSKPWSEADWKEYERLFGDGLEAWLDAGIGCKALARPDVREVVKRCVLRFDGDSLLLHAGVIKPTHVHLLLEPFEGHDLSTLLQGVKGASVRGANVLLGTAGTFWLDESYDHIVRSERQYQRFVRYIADNPVKAGLRDDEYWLHRGGTDVPVCGLEEGQTGMSASP